MAIDINEQVDEIKKNGVMDWTNQNRNNLELDSWDFMDIYKKLCEENIGTQYERDFVARVTDERISYEVSQQNKHAELTRQILNEQAVTKKPNEQKLRI